MSYNPYTLPRIERPTFTRDLESSNAPGEILSLTVRAPNTLDELHANSMANDAIRKYLTGEHELCSGGRPMEFPGLDADESVALSESLFQVAAFMEAMQVGGSKLQLETLVVIAARDPEMWDQLNGLLLEVQAGKRKRAQQKAD